VPLSNRPAKPLGASRRTALRVRPHAVAAAPELQRELLIVELVDEMTSWTPRDRMSAFRSWLKGSLSLIHLHVLTVLESEGPLPMSRLADTLDVSVASATGIVTRMEERGLVERRHDETDRRVVLVSPTEAGVAVFRDMMEHRRERLTGLLGRLTDDELQAFLVGLRAMRNARLSMRPDGLVTVETSGGDR
jgi:DNA-binding MarR family transcriptional regulator